MPRTYDFRIERADPQCRRYWLHLETLKGFTEKHAADFLLTWTRRYGTHNVRMIRGYHIGG